MSYKKVLALILMAITTEPAVAQGPFGAPPVSDAALAAERGTFRPSFWLTVNQLKRFQGDTARSDFGLMGSVGGIVMDNWWANDGASLISASRSVPR